MTIDGLGSQAENSPIHLFDMCVPIVSQALARCEGFEDECVQILFLRKGWWNRKTPLQSLQGRVDNKGRAKCPFCLTDNKLRFAQT